MRTHLLVLAALLLTALPAAAAPFTSTVASTDPDVQAQLIGIAPKISFLDGNRDAILDPGEPVYLDVDGQGTITVGDVRLTPYLRYAAGETVNFTNRDFDADIGTPLNPVNGWFGRDNGGLWYVDVDGTHTVTAGDLRLSRTGSPERVGAQDPAVGTPLEAVQATKPMSGRVAWLDLNGNKRIDPGESLYLDLSGSRQVEAGDLRITVGNPSVDDDATRADVDAAAARLADRVTQLETRLAAVEHKAGIASPSTPTQAPADAQAAPKPAPGFDAALAIIVGLGVLGWMETRRRW